jgi:hypothetical protein
MITSIHLWQTYFTTYHFSPDVLTYNGKQFCKEWIKNRINTGIEPEKIERTISHGVNIARAIRKASNALGN